MLDVTTRHGHRTATGWLVFAFVATGAGLGLALTSPTMPGAEPFTPEEVVDALAALGLGLLGVAFLRLRRAEGLGVALVLIAALSGVEYLTSGVAQAIANGEPDPQAVAQVLSLSSEGAFIAGFFLVVAAPLLLFPSGRLPSPRWRWPAGAVVVGCGAAIVSTLLTPGPVDEDNPAWGDNPIGVSALDGSADSVELVGGVFLLVGVLTGLTAFGLRWATYRGPRRHQMVWFSLGVVVMLLGLATDFADTAAVQVASAVAIFGSLLIGIGWPILGPLGRRAEDTDLAVPHPGSASRAPNSRAVHPTAT